MSDLPPPPGSPPPGSPPPASSSASASERPASVPPPPPGASPSYYVTPIGRPPERLGGAYYSTGLVILLTIVTLGIWAFLWTYRTSEDLKRYNGDGLGGVLAIVILFVFSPVLMFTIPNEIDKMYQRDGRQSPVSAIWGLWVLLPLIGNIIWYVRVQRSLNDFWTSKGSLPG